MRDRRSLERTDGFEREAGAVAAVAAGAAVLLVNDAEHGDFVTEGQVVQSDTTAGLGRQRDPLRLLPRKPRPVVPMLPSLCKRRWRRRGQRHTVRWPWH